MKSEQLGSEHESLATGHITPPAIELLLNSRAFAKEWPAHIAQNPDIQKQIEDRQMLIEQLDQVLAGLPRPDSSLDDAIRTGHLTEEQITNLYESLCALIANPEYRRAALYLPFELLPSKELKSHSATLADAAERFTQLYTATWHTLLITQDVRANFVDGDVLDVESRTEDLPRVVKAAHLIPELVKREILNGEEVEQLFLNAKDEILKQSLADALWVLADMKLLSRLSTAELEAFDRAHPRPTQTKPEHLTDKRRAWLKQEELRQAIEAEASRIAIVLTGTGMTEAHYTKYSDPAAPTQHQEAFALGIQIAVESLSKNFPTAAALYDQYREALTTLYTTGAPSVRERAAIALRRLASLGIVPATELDALHIGMPALAGPFSENLRHAPTEMAALQQMVSTVENDPTLSQMIYPAIVVFGSRLKGYGSEHADIDIGVFVRPATEKNKSAELRTALQKVFNHEKIHGEIVAFWLDEKDNALTVHNNDRPAASLGESHWTHVLFGAAWMGNATDIKELREKLLTPYFRETKEELHGLPARRLYIEELERDTLQYRLMHKGYARFFPPVSEMTAPHRDRIDGSSAFYDSGYRQTAIRLYARRVFLPKIST